jgi:hypothetical protein
LEPWYQGRSSLSSMNHISPGAQMEKQEMNSAETARGARSVLVRRRRAALAASTYSGRECRRRREWTAPPPKR